MTFFEKALSNMQVFTYTLASETIKIYIFVLYTMFTRHEEIDIRNIHMSCNMEANASLRYLVYIIPQH